ncbi:RINT1-like protein MAG2L [Mercurialis annua]|uniref:RINT1-like protein MAG2L n=1 Tax=Mercurialis annua TaxID=3986 RepID=UPI00215E7708|nr:RINT1-like protein MAG2L [Mercurialis annua]
MEPPPSLKPPCHQPLTAALPTLTELSTNQIEFLNKQLNTRKDLITKAPLLLTDLTKSYSDSHSDHINFQRNLAKRIVSWISHSFEAKSSVTDLNYMLENLSLRTSPYGFCSRKMKRFVNEEMPQIVKCLKRIESIGKYVDIALRLEALVGDLEDAVYSTGDLHARNMFSAKHLTSLISTDFGLKQERLVRAIQVMNNIEDILVDVAKFHPQWSHLLQSIDVRVDKSLVVVRPQILADYRALLASLGWPPKLLTSKVDSGEITSLPNPLVLMEGNKRKKFSESFLDVCALEHLQTRRQNRQCNMFGQNECTTRLWAIDELVSPFASRLEYHFSKWVEQPEFIFALVYKITKDFIVGVDDVLQPLIDRARLASYSAREAWVSAMVQMLSGFLSKSVVSVLVERYKNKDMYVEVASSWLYLMDHIVVFDKRMQSLVSSEINFFLKSEGHNEPSIGVSVLTMFCGRPDWLKIWAKIELKDAIKKLKLDLKDERAWSLDKESGVNFQHSAIDYKAPLVAKSAIKIAWEMIERCQSLPDILLRVRFIKSTTGKFLWYLLNVLVLRCKNTEFPLDYADNVLIKVCGSINAARYIASKLQEWSDDVNFLEMTVAEKKLDVNRNDNSADDNMFFAEEVKCLTELETNWLMDIITALLHHFEALSWEYLQHTQHFEHGRENFTSAAISVSSDIVEALDTLKTELNTLMSCLNPQDFLDLWRSVANGLDHFISSSIATSDVRYSRKGIDQFEADMQALLFVFRPFCARPEAFFPCIKEALRLLKMSREEINHFQVISSNVLNRTKILSSVGILHLTYDLVDKILMKSEFKS